MNFKWLSVKNQNCGLILQILCLNSLFQYRTINANYLGIRWSKSKFLSFNLETQNSVLELIKGRIGTKNSKFMLKISSLKSKLQLDTPNFELRYIKCLNTELPILSVFFWIQAQKFMFEDNIIVDLKILHRNTILGLNAETQNFQVWPWTKTRKVYQMFTPRFEG